MTPFDFLNEINHGKKDLMVDDIETWEKTITLEYDTNNKSKML